eukprot:1157919-Pelagomonas_calceolata.AAC.7
MQPCQHGRQTCVAREQETAHPTQTDWFYVPPRHTSLVALPSSAGKAWFCRDTWHAGPLLTTMHHLQACTGPYTSRTGHDRPCGAHAPA